MTPAESILGVFIAFVLVVTVYFFYAVRKVEALEEETETEEGGYLAERSKAILKAGTLKIVNVKGIGSKMSEKLKNAGITDIRQLASSNPAKLAESLGISKDRASRFIKNARSLLKNKPTGL